MQVNSQKSSNTVTLYVWLGTITKSFFLEIFFLSTNNNKINFKMHNGAVL